MHLDDYSLYDWCTLLNTMWDKGFSKPKVWELLFKKDMELYCLKDVMYQTAFDIIESELTDEEFESLERVFNYNNSLSHKSVRKNDMEDYIEQLLRRNMNKELFLYLKEAGLTHRFHIPKPVLEEAERRWVR